MNYEQCYIGYLKLKPSGNVEVHQWLKKIQKSLFSWDPIYTQKYDHMSSKKIIDTHKHLDISTMFRIPIDINIHYQKNILTKPSYRGR